MLSVLQQVISTKVVSFEGVSSRRHSINYYLEVNYHILPAAEHRGAFSYPCFQAQNRQSRGRLSAKIGLAKSFLAIPPFRAKKRQSPSQTRPPKQREIANPESTSSEHLLSNKMIRKHDIAANLEGTSVISIQTETRE